MNELLIVIELVLCVIAIYCFKRFFGCNGLFVYCAVATIAANIQVLKLTQLSFYNSPLALGSVIFSTIFIVDNLITEDYGVSKARECILLTAAGYLFFSLSMYLCIQYEPAGVSSCSAEIARLFKPSLAILISSVFSYTLSQLVNVHLLDLLKKVSFGKFKWFRFNVAPLVASFLDQVLFSFLTWKVFIGIDLGIGDILLTYVTFGYIFRAVIIVIVNTFFVHSD